MICISARGSQESKSDSKTVNQRAAPVEQEEPGWDEPAPSKIEKPLAQSTPSHSKTTTPAKPPAVPLSPRDKGTAEQKTRIDTLRTATLPLNKEVLVSSFDTELLRLYGRHAETVCNPIKI